MEDSRLIAGFAFFEESLFSSLTQRTPSTHLVFPIRQSHVLSPHISLQKLGACMPDALVQDPRTAAREGLQSEYTDGFSAWRGYLGKLKGKRFWDDLPVLTHTQIPLKGFS